MDDSTKMIRLVRQLDQTKRELATEKRRTTVLQMQNNKLRRAVITLQRRQAEAAAKVG